MYSRSVSSAWLFQLSMGDFMIGTIGGTTTGTIPRARYGASIRLTTATSFIAGRGRVTVTKSIARLRSSPVTVNVDSPGLLDGCSCC